LFEIDYQILFKNPKILAVIGFKLVIFLEFLVESFYI